MNPEIISLGELLVEIMRPEINIAHGKIGQIYKGPYPSGAPLIFIDSAARMSKIFGFNSGFIGVIGNDEFGDCIIKKMKKDEIDISQIRVDRSKTTGIAFNQYNSDGSRKFIFAPGAAGETSSKDVKIDYFEKVQVLHIMGSALSISKSSRQACYKALKIAKNINPKVIISFDPNLRPEMLDIDTILEIYHPILRETHILLPSGEEAEMLAGIEGSKEACKKLLNMGPNMVVLKQGKDGAMIFTNDLQSGIQASAISVKEVDPTGAGDSFGGAFVAAYLA
ncbi:MAG: sugar kinase [Candidatus Lokiarchaeota archaeon]